MKINIPLETQHRICEFFYRTSAPRLYAMQLETERQEREKEIERSAEIKRESNN